MTKHKETFADAAKSYAKAAAIGTGLSAGNAAASTITSGIISSGLAASAGGFMITTITLPAAAAYGAYKVAEAVIDAFEGSEK